ncbi:siroheme synthase CysG [Candidatus Marithrix sp. Canyon 246]|uniref:siroheme synthase CysG n=1 Tax=Candidatus Marithrix sp. Canyon 246 TaxID=1827136 RepID=UPI00084A1C47|nr:siroheme synthase CysG [Candidatus Marithrix sp. Canyon 246]
MNFLPIFFNIRDHKTLVVGGGATAARKAALLLRAGAKVTVVAPELKSKFDNVEYHQDYFAPKYLQDCRLVIAATNDKNVNEQVSKLAQQQNIPVNVVDQPDLCSFIMPAIIDRSPIQIAVSTGGTSPVLARLLRTRLEAMIPSGYGKLAEFVASFRDKVKQRLDFPARRPFWEKVLQGNIAEMVFSGKTNAASKALEDLLANTKQEHGEVYLVGGGPGDPDLLTFKAVRLMQQADVVLYDRLVSAEVLDMVRRDAELIYVGKQPTNHPVPQEQINQLLIRLAKEGKRVLRLKGGDPFLFGRGGEEIETLMEQGIAFQVVPAVTAAIGSSAYAGIPLTHRDYAQSCIFVTGHLKDNSIDLNWQALTQPQQTVVIYMGLNNLATICSKLIEHGMSKDKPIALIQKATTSEQRVLVGTLETLPAIVEEQNIKLSSIIIIGDVVKLHQKLAWFKPHDLNQT